jgi:hypothetical protein
MIVVMAFRVSGTSVKGSLSSGAAGCGGGLVAWGLLLRVGRGLAVAGTGSVCGRGDVRQRRGAGRAVVAGLPVAWVFSLYVVQAGSAWPGGLAGLPYSVQPGW